MQTRRALLWGGLGALALPQLAGAALPLADWDTGGRGKVALDTPLLSAEGPSTLGAILAGRPAFIALWAPWCVPCLREKPSLDVLAGQARARNLGVAVLSIQIQEQGGGRATLRTANTWHQKLKLQHLAPLVDPNAGRNQGQNIAWRDFIDGTYVPLPTAILLRPDGSEIARRVGVRLASAPSPGQSMKKFMQTAKLSGWDRPEHLALLEALAANPTGA